MIIAIALYALVSAAVLGWLTREHLYARYESEAVPAYIFVLLPLLWLPVAVAAILAFIGLLVASKLREWRE